MPEVNEGSVVDGRYRVLRRIGSGGMADVWLAEDAHLQRPVALKVLHRRFAQDGEFVERFRREAEAAAGLQHPNIVAVFDRGDFEGTYYIAMQYIEGPTLKQLIDSGLAPDQAVAMIRQVLEAARFAHRKGIVHRDLKPQNVLVDGDGKAVVTDFGIARAGVSEITQTGSVMGTPHYLSPEQAQGFDVTAVSDLYSIGVILYEALTGRVPFEGDSAVAVAMKQVSQTPQRPSSINPQVSPALDAVVMRALEKDPGERFQNADAFIAALDAAMKEPGGAGGGTAAFAALPPVVATPEEAAAEELDPDEEARKRRRRWIAAALAAVLIGLLVGFALTRDTTTDVPDGHRQPAERRDRPAPAGRLRGRRSQAGRTSGAGQHRPRAGPGRLATWRQGRTRLLLPDLLLLEAGGDPDRQRRAGQRRCAGHRRARTGRGGRKARSRRLRGRTSKRSTPTRSKKAWFSTPNLGRADRDARHRGDAVRLQRPEAGQGAGAGRQPARRRRAADPQPRLRSGGLRRRKLLAGGQGDRPVAGRRQRDRSRVDRLDRRLQRRKADEGAERDRQAPGRSGRRRCAKPASAQPSKKRKPRWPAKPAA